MKKIFIISIIIPILISSCDTFCYQDINENVLEHYENKNIDCFLFFTDPHMFYSNNSYDIDYSWFANNIPILQAAYKENYARFLMCGGDLLNNNDSRNQAMFKLFNFSNIFQWSFESFYTIVGNHDTNYQGDKFIKYGDYEACKLSRKDLEKSLFNGRSAYYSFDTELTRYYCFDSDIDWIDVIDEYKIEQLKFFASDLLTNSLIHSAVFIHIAVRDGMRNLSNFTKEIGKIIDAYNKKKTLFLFDSLYDYSSNNGKIEFIQAGHMHEDLVEYICGDIPVIVTRAYNSEQPTFDCVKIDYNNMKIQCNRYGGGEDRVIDIS